MQEIIAGLPFSHPELIPLAEHAIRNHILMRDVFHCTPSQLMEEDHAMINLHWSIRESLRKEEANNVQ